MKKNARKAINLLLCVVALISLFCACGKDGANDSKPEPTSAVRYVIPDVRGVYYSDAITMVEDGLEAAGFKDYEVRYCWSWENYDPAMNARILYSNPSAGTEIVDNGQHVFIELVAGEQAPEPQPQPKKLVVFFSATGNTERIAWMIAEIEGADSYEIIPAEAYTAEDINYNDYNCRALKEQGDTSARPAIAGETIDLSEYSVIYFGYPIWAASEPRIMDTFVESYDFGEARVIPFCTSGSSGIGSTATRLKMLAGSGDWQSGKRFSGNATIEEVKAWIDSME